MAILKPFRLKSLPTILAPFRSHPINPIFSRWLPQGARPHRHNNCCQCAASDLAQTVTVATMNNRRRSSTIHVCLRGNLHQFMDV